MKTIQLRVTGRVNGVGYRHYVKKKANEYKIFGFVQNESEGSILIEAEGEHIDIETFLDCCYRGSVLSKIRDVKVYDLPFRGYVMFEIKN